MSGINVLYRIPAVRSREIYAEHLREKLGEPESSIYWDEERKGSVWNKWRILNSHKDYPDATHICMLDDDADVVNNFKALAEKAVSAFPDSIMTFCHCNANPVRMAEKPLGSPYLKLANYDFRGISMVVPVMYIDDFMEWWTKWLSHYPKNIYKRDDTSWKMYACVKRIDCILTVPNLVRALEIPSAIHPQWSVRNSDLWTGYDVEPTQFDVDWYGVRQSKKLFDFHLKKDEPVVRYVTAEYKKQLAFM